MHALKHAHRTSSQYMSLYQKRISEDSLSAENEFQYPETIIQDYLCIALDSIHYEEQQDYLKSKEEYRGNFR